jgi:hypothetical protein
MTRLVGRAETGDAENAALRHRVAQHRYGVLLLSLGALFLVQGVVPAGAVQQIAVTFLAGTSALLAFHACGIRIRLIRIATVFAVIALGLSIARALFGGIGEGAALAMDAVLVALGPPAVALGVLRNIRASGQVHLESVMGVLALYLLLGMLFALVYGAMDRLGGDPVFAGGQAATASNCLYFSFTTLTTVGYGDLVARTDLGHTLAVSEALIGQIYLVTVVSVLVSNLGRSRAGRNG